MNGFGYKAVVLCALGALAGGCTEAAGLGAALEPAALRDDARASVSGTLPGSGGQNGLLPVDFHASKGAFFATLALPLYIEGSLGPAASELVSTQAGRSTFSYALQCAPPAGKCVGKGPGACDGGLLATTDAWENQGLGNDVAGQAARADLFACVATHLNATGETVPFRLTGAAVRNEEGFDPSAFVFQEALWLATPGTSKASPVSFDVWPLADLSNHCGTTRALASLERQICGDDLTGCQLRLRTDLGACETDETGSTTCDGRRAIKTWLKTEDVAKRHPLCD